MEKLILLILAFVLCSSISAQVNETDFISRTATLQITVDNIAASDKLIMDLVEDYDLIIENFRKDSYERTNNYVLLTNMSAFNAVITMLETMGIPTLNKIETTNNVNDLRGIDYDLEYFSDQKIHYQEEIQKLYQEITDDYYRKLWESERALDESLYKKNKVRIELLNEVEFHRIVLEVTEKTAQDLDDDDDEFAVFINMPGIESHFFYIENPELSVSADAYFGGSLRYMFTRGRTYVTVGALKPVMNADSEVTAQANDILVYGVGKDFYPRYLGHGRRKFFNLYSGFLVGGMVLTSDDEIYHIFTVEPHIGVEMFKNQYFIIDTRFGYLIPIEQDKIKILRGFNHSLSLNIVF